MSGEAGSRHHPARRLFSALARTTLGILLGLAIAYSFGAVWFDGPLGGPASMGNILLALLWLAALAAALVLFRKPGRRPAAVAAALGVVLVPWSFIRPSNDRDWKPEFAETGWVEIEGDLLRFHQVRDFDYTRDGDVTERWITREHHLSELAGLDYFHDAFGGDLLAHPILSFDFGGEGHLCLSIETRREVGESFSALGGLFKMFELQYLFGTEPDFIRVRTNIRDEPVFLYRTRFGPVEARRVLLESIAVQNRLRDQPRFYNVLTANCTTSLRAQTPAEDREAFDWRMLVNGRLDEYVHEKGAIIDEGLPFEALRDAARINEAAIEAHHSPDFSAAIREGRPGF